MRTSSAFARIFRSTSLAFRSLTWLALALGAASAQSTVGLEQAVTAAEFIVVGSDADHRLPAVGSFVVASDYVLKGPDLSSFNLQGSLLLEPDQTYLLFLRTRPKDAKSPLGQPPIFESVTSTLTPASPGQIAEVMKILRTRSDAPIVLKVHVRLVVQGVKTVRFYSDGRFEEHLAANRAISGPEQKRTGNVSAEKVRALVQRVANEPEVNVLDEQPDFSEFKWLDDNGFVHRKNYQVPNKPLLEAIDQLIQEARAK